MIINSKEGSDLLPLAYTNNDFDDLFDDIPREPQDAMNETFKCYQQQQQEQRSCTHDTSQIQTSPQNHTRENNAVSDEVIGKLQRLKNTQKQQQLVQQRSQQSLEINGCYNQQQLNHNDVVTTPMMSRLFPLVAKQQQPHRRTNATKKRSCHEVSRVASDDVSVPLPASSTSGVKRLRKLNVIASHVRTHQNKKQAETSTIKSPFCTYLDILKSRSYDTSSFISESKYSSTPSELQKASFGNAVLKTVAQCDSTKLRSLLSSGLSPNPCNQFGDSLINNICRRGTCHEKLFNVMIDCGASVQTCDHFGRTPLHFVCWSADSSFASFETIVSLDGDMLCATDKVGKTPLEYISSDKWDCWNQFLNDKKNIFWPDTKQRQEGYSGKSLRTTTC